MNIFTNEERNEIEIEIKLNKYNKKEANVFRKSLIEFKKRNSTRDKLKAKIEYKGMSFQEKMNKLNPNQ